MYAHIGAKLLVSFSQNALIWFINFSLLRVEERIVGGESRTGVVLKIVEGNEIWAEHICKDMIYVKTFSTLSLICEFDTKLRKPIKDKQHV